MASLSWNSGILFFIPEFQWFFIELSVLPTKCLAISAHLFSIEGMVKSEGYLKLCGTGRGAILRDLPRVFS